jgi:cytidylate kinase
MVEVVAIDGPVGVGKSSVARLLSSKFGWQHLDTGAMYRAVAWLALESGVDPADAAKTGEIARAMKIEFHPSAEGQRVTVNGREATEAIRSHEVNNAVSIVSDHVGVREELGRRQKEMGRARPSVAEGRDMGTVVFPDARWKFFLDADPRERARRRGNEFAQKGNALPEAELLASLAERDRRDRERPVGALRVAADAVVVDTTGMDLNRVVHVLECIIRADMPAKS